MGKKIAYGAVFGILIGLWEVFFGNFLHQLRIPFRGEILSAFDILIFSYAFTASRRREVVLYITAVAIAIKTALSGTFMLGPVIGLAMTGILFTFGSMIKKWGYVIGGALAGAWAPFYFGIIKVKLLGPELLDSYNRLFSSIGIKLTTQQIIHMTIVTGAVLGIIAAIIGRSMVLRK